MKKSGDWWICDEEQNMMKYTEVAKKGDPSWQGNFPLYLNKFVPEDKRGVFLDIGANYGFMVTAMSKFYDRVEAFEVIPKTFECLKLNCEGLENVVLHDCGLGETNDKMYAKRRKKTAGHSQIINDQQQLDLYLSGKHPKQHMVEIVEIPIKTLDSFNYDRIDLMKIDVEGFEEFVLAGAEETIKRCKPVIALEVTREKKTTVKRSSIDTVKLVESWGYKFVEQRKDDFMLIPN